ncbi:hypothetical protein HY642_06780 [Candidatus Woesearchaeota archaeon]|nr:hypothetical protein [Candidatus Woesearchaeota archaeon]
MIRNIKDIKECPDCAGTNLVYDVAREQVICRDCGLIFEPLVPSDEEKFEAAHELAPAKAKARKAAKKRKK